MVIVKPAVMEHAVEVGIAPTVAAWAMVCFPLRGGLALDSDTVRLGHNDA